MRKYITIRSLTKKGLIFMLISVLAIAYLQNTYTIYRVVSTSMAPYLKDGDFVLVKSLEKDESIYKNDIILFDFNNSKIVKRVLGFENESISFYQYSIENKIDESVFNTVKLRRGESPPNYIKVVEEQRTWSNRIICVGDNITSSYFYIVDRKSTTDKFIFNITKGIGLEFI